ncbi:MAG: magnesium transporter, partial [Hyphomicrobiaceae bacterium]|nr:magnesium transporter [Hyphomicrobiaceae bacterium]
MTEAEVTRTDAEGAAVEPTQARVAALSAAVEAGDAAAINALIADLRAPDIADLIEVLEPDERVRLIELAGAEFDFEVLSELDATVRDQLTEALPNDLLAKAVTELDTDDAAYLIESLEADDRKEILDQLDFDDRAALERNLEYDEETAGRLMQSEFVAVAPFWDVGRVIDHMREADDLPEHFSEIYVVDPAFRVLGAVDLSRLLRTKRHVPVGEIMNADRHVVLATEDQEEVARQFRRYDLMSAPVVDENNRLVGVVTVDDVVEVIEEEAEEDIKAMAGVGDETLADSVYWTARSRIPWLVVNLGTALLASFVIGLFDATIEEMVALAVLMPVVASIGGNAAMQTTTVTVRALATNKLSRLNAARVIGREAVVGLVNGAVISLLIATVVFLWFGSGPLAGVIAAAIVVNLLVAAMSGILIPMALDRFDIDPAPSS